MRILPPVEEEIRRIVRDARAKDPLIRVAGLKLVLEDHFGRGFSHQYISKIADKVAREGLVEADRTKLEERLQFTRENYRIARERLLQIIYWKPDDGGKPPLNRDVNEAAKNIVMMDLAILQAEAAAGMYRKPIDELAKAIHYEPLPDEVRAVVIAAWRRGSMLPREDVEVMVPSLSQPLPSLGQTASHPATENTANEAPIGQGHPPTPTAA